jgi:putative tricarboxylic transport membrane protein
MAPAAAGGGWDTTARAFQQGSRDAKLDDGVEVFNVEGAGGTLELSEPVSKSSGDAGRSRGGFQAHPGSIRS